MTEINFNKLIRDNMEDQDWFVRHVRRLNKEEHVKALIRKLFEEAGEYQETLCEQELADVLHVVECLAEVQHGMLLNELEYLAKDKCDQKGSLMGAVFLERITPK